MFFSKNTVGKYFVDYMEDIEKKFKGKKEGWLYIKNVADARLSWGKWWFKFKGKMIIDV